MSDQPDLSEIKRRKSRNVQEQVAVLRDSILREATWWRNNPIAPAIRESIERNGKDVSTGILVNVCDREFGLEDCADGIFVAASGQFFEFSVELTPDGDKLIAVHQFDDVTDSLEICGHKPGVGATWAFLVIEVLKELNEKSDTEDGASSR